MEGELREYANGPLSSLSLPQPGGYQDTTRRRLLLIYIHGFMGSEASFHNLPAHVHDALTGLLSESHVVYTRIYPRYKSHGELQAAVNQFSSWLSPHEAKDLDVVLLGHSLGGILAADVALLQLNGQPKHRILGLVNYDVPFLGLHPRVIPTGITSSIPKKDIAAEDQLAGEQESLGLTPAYKAATPSPNFDPPFRNDVRIVERGFLKGIMHFVNKNTDNLSRSIFDRLVSPMKFAGCVNNYSELRQRHKCLIDLESAEYSPDRVRFVNYYTTSTGRPARKPKASPTKEQEDIDDSKGILSGPSLENLQTLKTDSEPSDTTFTENLTLEEESVKSIASGSTLTVEGVNSDKERPSTDTTNSKSASTEFPSSADDRESQHLSEPVSLATSESDLSSETSKQKLRKFILLPSHHWKYNDNAHWMPILMEDMDEVTAHQSMFMPQSTHYSYLVGDTVALIEQWVQTDLSRRLLQESLD
ncbi:hypothetical protein N7462_010689 [Penicillium macrosclerotiorum]|uniref:uncharacterized protein n=1 Tax=Penicillium macrosclerotiorum TaxID=303699 RepID=UPI0025484655|nr:uncharacterized protein N7462_010689 [Penicillium macrosclerotiorum]KAJ5669619.1 hypothetical protein N7462_010689 [Penicillium macrosclerotiorum]